MNALEYYKTSDYKYRVAADYVVALPEIVGVTIEHKCFTIRDGVGVIRAGYAWDGASGPTLDTPATMAASLVHDVLYQCIRAGLLGREWRVVADRILRRLMRAAERRWAEARTTALRRRLALLWIDLRANYYFYGVRLFGASCIQPRPVEPQDQIYVA